MAKVYYTEQEACDKLKMLAPDLAKMVRDSKLRAFQDGPRRMYKVDEVDKLVASTSSEMSASGEIQLTPADTGTISGMSLSEADKPRPSGKEDTVITAEGISIFDDEDLEIAADPMAKTQISTSMEDSGHIEGVGSGSCLLDLTRESDDTSLGAEVLDHIDMDSVGSGMSSVETPAIAPAYAPAYSAPSVVEELDPASGAFSGMVVGAAVVSLIMTIVAAGLASGTVPGIVGTLKENIAIVLVIGVVVIAAAAVVGFVLAKGAADRQAALQRMQ